MFSSWSLLRSWSQIWFWFSLILTRNILVEEAPQHWWPTWDTGGSQTRQRTDILALLQATFNFGLNRRHRAASTGFDCFLQLKNSVCSQPGRRQPWWAPSFNIVWLIAAATLPTLSRVTHTLWGWLQERFLRSSLLRRSNWTKLCLGQPCNSPHSTKLSLSLGSRRQMRILPLGKSLIRQLDIITCCRS